MNQIKRYRYMGDGKIRTTKNVKIAKAKSGNMPIWEEKKKKGKWTATHKIEPKIKYKFIWERKKWR